MFTYPIFAMQIFSWSCGQVFILQCWFVGWAHRNKQSIKYIRMGHHARSLFFSHCKQIQHQSVFPWTHKGWRCLHRRGRCHPNKSVIGTVWFKTKYTRQIPNDYLYNFRYRQLLMKLDTIWEWITINGIMTEEKTVQDTWIMMIKHRDGQVAVLVTLQST